MPSRSGVRASIGATGTLSHVPLSLALVHVRNKRLSGVLELTATGRCGWAAFWRGQAVSVMTTPPVARCATVVYELGLIDAKTLDATTTAAALAQRPPMDLLVERGAITPAQRDLVLMEQVRRRILNLFTLPLSTVFTFREGRPSMSEPSIVVDLLAPVWRGLRDFPPTARVDEALAHVGDRPLRFARREPATREPDFAVIERGELSSAEADLYEQLARRPMTLGALRAHSRLSTRHVDLVVYFLLITRYVEVVGAERPVVPSSDMWIAPPHARSAGEAFVPNIAVGPELMGVAAIRRRAESLTTESPCAALGLDEGASTEAVRAAYFRLAKLWHPDRLPHTLEAARPEVERIYAHMTAAHRWLTDPEARPASRRSR
ncbi:MAG: DnaJ domain-containing protein [Labilithrix sp.]|nr:DnaJ domain-containing protein [Labilithrix sp.]